MLKQPKSGGRGYPEEIMYIQVTFFNFQNNSKYNLCYSYRNSD